MTRSRPAWPMRARSSGSRARRASGDALDRGHAPDPADHECLRGDTEEPPQASAVAASVDPAVQVDAEPDDAELVAGGDPELDEVVPDFRADGDEPCRHPRELFFQV